MTPSILFRSSALALAITLASLPDVQAHPQKAVVGGSRIQPTPAEIQRRKERVSKEHLEREQMRLEPIRTTRSGQDTIKK